MGLIVPQLLKKYGAGQAVSISGKFAKTFSGANFTSGRADAHGALEVFISVNNETAIQAEFDQLQAGADLNSTNGTIHGRIDRFSFGTITESTFKTTLWLTADQLLATLQSTVGDIYIIAANKALAAGVVIPKIMGIDVHDVEINFT